MYNPNNQDNNEADMPDLIIPIGWDKKDGEGSASLVDANFNNAEKKQLLGRYFSRILKDWMQEYDGRPLKVSPCAQTISGETLLGSAFVPANLLMKFNRDWIDIFVSEEDLKQYKLEVFPNTRSIYTVDRELSNGDVIYTEMWNLSDTNAHKVMPELYRAFRERYETMCRERKGFIGKGANDMNERNAAINAGKYNLRTTQPELVVGIDNLLTNIFNFTGNCLYGGQATLYNMQHQMPTLPDDVHMYDLLREIGFGVDDWIGRYPGVSPRTISAVEICHQIADKKEAAAKEKVAEKSEQTRSNIKIG